MSTLAELRAEVMDHGFAASKYSTYVTQWLNEGQREVCLRAELRTEVTTTEEITTDHQFALPDDFASLIEVSDATDSNDWQRLSPMELRDFDEAPVATGSPFNYVVTGQVLYLYPYPDSQVTIAITYRKLPAALTLDTDVPEIPLHYHHLLVRYALVRCYQRQNDFQAADYSQQQFESDLTKLKGVAQTDTYDPPSIIPGTWADQVILGPRLP